MDGDVEMAKTKIIIKEVGEASPAPEQSKPVIVIKHSCGRLGGTTTLLAIAQRAMWNGCKVQIIDGDLKSQTLMSFYPPGTDSGAIVPSGNDETAFKNMLLEQSDAMATDRISRVVVAATRARPLARCYRATQADEDDGRRYTVGLGTMVWMMPSVGAACAARGPAARYEPGCPQQFLLRRGRSFPFTGTSKAI